MCGHQHHEHHEHRHSHRGFGRRGLGFGRGGFPPREEWLERLQAYRAHLEEELRNVGDLIERLGPSAEGASQT
jgi:hypothetical protein